MSNSTLYIDVRHEKDQLVAGIRFRGEPKDAGMYLCTLYDLVKRYARGNPMCLIHDLSETGNQDLEVCFPVVYPVNRGAVRSRNLRGGAMACTYHAGAGGSPGAPATAAEAWIRFYELLNARHIAVAAHEPAREIYMVKSPQFDSAGYVTELQVPLCEVTRRCTQNTHVSPEGPALQHASQDASAA